MKAFPLFITVENRPLVVFGGGEEAAAKIRLLLKTDARVIAVAADFEPAVAGLPGLVRVQQDPLCFDLPAGTAFAYAATGNEQLDAALAVRTRNAGVLVCAADQPSVSDFSTPALVDRDPVIVAIGTEGTAPVLARAIKAQIEFLLEPSLGQIARTAAGLRAQIAHRLKPGQPRRDFWRRFFSKAREQRLETPIALDAMAQEILYESPAASDAGAGTLTIVGTGAGEADLLTIAGHRALDAASVVLHDPLVARPILELARREATIRVLHPGSTREILSLLEQGENVVRLVVGNGSLAEPEQDAAAAAGLPVRFIPGIDPDQDSPSSASSTHQTAHRAMHRSAHSLSSPFSRKAA